MFAHTIDPSIVKWFPEGMLDFIIVTPEHTAYDIGDFLAVRHALEAKGIACLARTHTRDESDIAKVCDSYDGVVVPTSRISKKLNALPLRRFTVHLKARFSIGRLLLENGQAIKPRNMLPAKTQTLFSSR